MIRRRWNNVSGRCSVELTMPQLTPQCVADAMVGHEWAELVIEFSSSGYYDPGCRYMPNGDPGYPPEGDDERLPGKVYLIRADGSEHVFGDKDAEDIFEFYRKSVEEVEIEPDRD